jgi:hypothetical protein
MKRIRDYKQTVGLLDLPEDVLFVIQRFFFRPKKKNSLDIRGFERLYSLSLTCKYLYRVFVKELMPMLTMQCDNFECQAGLGRFICGSRRCSEGENLKWCKRCCRKCVYCRQIMCKADADMTKCYCCKDRYCNDDCAIFGFPYCCGGSGYQGELCKNCHNPNSSDEDTEERERKKGAISMESDYSSDSGLSSLYSDSEMSEKSDVELFLSSDSESEK